MNNSKILEEIQGTTKNRIQNLSVENENSSLYIGDLSSKVTENDILYIFSKMSGLLYVKICRDVFSKKSLGYGYINFESTKYAKKALKKMNFYFDKNLFKKPIRLMWKEKNKALRISGKGNIFINHLPVGFKTIDLYKLCMPFGKILSCKICFDEDGNSKKFGFVHFFSFQNAKEAIKNLNGKLVKGKKIHISPFIKKETRDLLLPKNKNFTNIYIKDISVDKLNEEDMRNIFEVFGKITSISIPMEKNKPKGFAFVNFESHLDAEEAVFKMNKKKVGESILYVSRAETKMERKYFLNNSWNIKKKLLEKLTKKNYIVIKGIGNKFLMKAAIFLYWALGKFSKFKIIKLNQYEFSSSLNISFEKKKISITTTKKKYQNIFSKFLEKFFKYYRQKIYSKKNQDLLYENHSPYTINYSVKFSKNDQCFKFKEIFNKTLVINKFKIFGKKKDFQDDIKQLTNIWLDYIGRNDSNNIVRFMNLFSKNTIKNLIFFNGKSKWELEIPSTIW